MKKNKLQGSSFNKQEEILKFLKSDLPEVFSEGKIDCKKLKQTLGEEVDDSDERYGLSWAGKSGCFQTIQEQTTATLKLAKDESVNFDETQNLFIEGDNLEVLKVLQRSYYGKVKMIYIDPPYNTGGDFIYNDNFRKSKKDEMIETGEMNGDGDLTRADGLSINRKDSNGHFHSDWLNMMYPRLFLARNLLQQDGAIFVSIDDNEVKNLRMIMDEIFGEENFIGQIIVKSNPRGSQEPSGISSEHEYLLCYGKSEESKLSIVGYERNSDDDEFSFVDKDGRKARLLGLRKRGGDWKRVDRPNMFYPFYVNPKNEKVSLAKTGEYSIEVLPVRPDGVESRWTWGQSTAKENIKQLVAKVIKRNGSDIYDIYRIDHLESESGERKREKVKSIWEDKELNYQYARQYFKDYFGSSEIFDFPKSPYFIAKIVSSLNDKDGIILDFFAGSGTTAQAIMEQNAKDDGNRKWICVQLPELCDEESEAYKAGYKTIAEIGKERIRRAGKKIEESVSEKRGYLNGLEDVYGYKKGEIKEVQSEMESPAYDFDCGFKVLKLDKSNFKIWQGKFENTENLLNAMAEFVDNVQKGSKEENILFELILKSGLDLNVPIEEKEFGGDRYYSLDSGKLMVYLGKKITKDLAEEIQKAKPEKFICLDGCFQNNDQLKTNISLQMEQEKIDFRVI